MLTNAQQTNRAILLTTYRTKLFGGMKLKETRGTYGETRPHEMCARGVIALMFPNSLRGVFAWPVLYDVLATELGITGAQAQMMTLDAERYFEGWHHANNHKKESFKQIANRIEKFWKMCDAWNKENPA